jgi:hypothetical protein
MPRTAWRFTNPVNAALYDFPINPSEEEAFGKRRNVEHSSPTGLTGLVRQQGDDQPLVLKASGTILTRAQLVAMIGWFQLCRTQTIYLRDHAGDQYEGLLTAFEPTRKRTLRNPRDLAQAPEWYWTYTIEFEVVRIISGTWAGVTP